MNAPGERLHSAGAIAGGLDLDHPAVMAALLHNMAALVSAAAPEVWDDEGVISAACDLVETLAPGALLDADHDLGPPEV